MAAIIEVTTPGSLFNIAFFESTDFLQLIFKASFTGLMLFILIRLLYYPNSRRRDYMFTFFLIGTIVFLLCYMLENVKLQIGMALGLFAIFGILRFRTIQISIKEMAYLFLVIGVAVINALANKKTSWAELLLANFILLGVTWIIERVLFRKPTQMVTVTYEKIELLNIEKRAELIADLENRTGLKIYKIEIERLNFLRDTARIIIFYKVADQPKK